MTPLLGTLSIRDFGAVKSADIDLSKPAVLFGANGGGKTTVIDAIRYIAQGYCSRCDADGAGIWTYAPRDGSADCASISLEIGGLVAHSVIYPRGHKPVAEWYVTDGAGNVFETYPNRQALWFMIESCGGPSMAHAAICLDPVGFLSRKELSAALSALNVTSIDLDLQGTPDQVAWLKTWTAARRLPTSTVPDLVAVGAAAFARRTDMKRDLARDKANLPGPGEAVLPPGITPATAPARLATAREEARTAQAAVQALNVERRLSQEAEQVDVDLLRAELAGLDAEIETSAAVVLKRQADVEAANSTRKVDEAYVNDAEVKLSMERHTAATAAGIAKAMAMLTLCDDCRAKNAPAKPATPEGADPVETARVALAGANAGLAMSQSNLNHKKEAHAEAVRAHAALVRKRDQHQGRLDAASEATPKRPVVELDAEIVTQITKIETTMPLVTALEKWTAREELRHKIETDEVEIKRLSWAIEMFLTDAKHTGAAYASAARGPLQEFADRANAALVDQYNMYLTFDIEKGNVIPYLSIAGNEPHRLTECSGGEQTVAALAIADQFAGSGGVIALDEVNRADGDNRTRIMAALKARSGSALVCCAWPFRGEQFDGAKQAAAWAPVNVYHIQEGVVTKCQDA